MTHKVHPRAFRLGYNKDWKSRWFNKKKYKQYLEQDYKLREFILQRLKRSGVKEVEIKRSANSIKIVIHSARPGIIIGRGGSGIQELKRDIVNKIFKGKVRGLEIKIDVEELKKAETHAEIVAQGVAEQLEQRRSFRRAMKQALSKVMQTSEVKGARICVAGRLGGAEMARTECTSVEGKLPLQSLRANIDYAYVPAHTTYGIIGVKVWLYKGEKFE